MDNDARSDQEVQEAARRLFEGVVPERSDDLKALWNQYQPRFNLLTDVGPEGLFVMGAGLYREVVFNHRALRAFWLASFIAWEGYLKAHEVATEGEANFDRFNDMIDVFWEMLTEEDPLDVGMPEGVSEPGAYPDREKYPQERAAAEVATFATGWAFLHEIRHLKHQQDGTSATSDAPARDQHKEELSCDEYATTFILDGVDQYAKDQGVNTDKVKQKRELGVYFAMFAMTLIGAGQWDASGSHPAMQARIDAAIQQMGGSGTRVSDAIAHAAFASLWFRWPDAPGPFLVKDR
jgi:hypothetical protein